MARLFRVALFGLLVACGPKAKPTNLAPLPDDKPATPVAEESKPTPEEQLEAEKAPADPGKPLDPVELTIPAPSTTVKLVTPGKGKREALRYTAKAGGTQQIELAMDFAYKATVHGKPEERVTPTVVLLGSSEAKAVDKDGKAEFKLTVTSTDARPASGAEISLDNFKRALASLSGLVIDGSVGPNGLAGDTKLRIEKPDEMSKMAIDLVRLALPGWPALPAETVAVGAKWQTTTSTKLADKIAVTQVTDYELVARKAGTWTIKSATKVSGVDQEPEPGQKVSNISGTGTSEITLADGALYPTTKSSLATQFHAVEKTKQGDVPLDVTITVGSAITAK